MDTDKHASPFDILLAMDLYPEAEILYYSNVTSEDAKKLVQDAMFPRGPSGAKHTKLFIGGYNVEEANDIIDVAKKAMFPPFQLAMVVDPRGAHTTASAAVAKTLALLKKRNLGELKGKKVTVLAATGPVGEIITKIYVNEAAQVTVTSRTLEKAQRLAQSVNSELKVQAVKGARASNPEEVGEAISGAEIVVCAGAAGAVLLPLRTIKECASCKVVADINAIPPLGVEGLEATADAKEFSPDVFGSGALAIGTLKNSVEAELLRRAMDSASGIFDYKIAYEIAKKMVLEKD